MQIEEQNLSAADKDFLENKYSFLGRFFKYVALASFVATMGLAWFLNQMEEAADDKLIVYIIASVAILDPIVILLVGNFIRKRYQDALKHGKKRVFETYVKNVSSVQHDRLITIDWPEDPKGKREVTVSLKFLTEKNITNLSADANDKIRISETLGGSNIILDIEKL